LQLYSELVEDLKVGHVGCGPDEPEEGVRSDGQADGQALGGTQGSVDHHGRGGDEPGRWLPDAGGEGRQKSLEWNRVGMGDTDREGRDVLGPSQGENGAREIVF
jgi:hypothetical protein